MPAPVLRMMRFNTGATLDRGAAGGPGEVAGGFGSVAGLAPWRAWLGRELANVKD